MSRTLLNGVNDVLKRLGDIKSNSGVLSSLTDSQRQVKIDLVLQIWNEVILDLYDSAELQFPNEMGTAVITLATGDRDYSLPADLVYIRWPLRSTTNSDAIYEYPGGFEQILADQPAGSSFTGRPTQATIRPSDGLLYVDRVPQAAENGLQYTLYYDKSLLMSLAADIFPFNDDIYTELIPGVAERMKMEQDGQSEARYAVSQVKYGKAIGRAAAKLTKNLPRTSYAAQDYYGNSSDPMET